MREHLAGALRPVLLALSGAVGVGLTWLAVHFLDTTKPVISMNSHVLAFTDVVTLATSLVFGVILTFPSQYPIHNATYFSSALGKSDLVDSAGYNYKTRLSGSHIHSEAMHIQERFHRRDLGHVDMEMTVDNPVTLTKPVTVNSPKS